jgi:hypothetical protein
MSNRHLWILMAGSVALIALLVATLAVEGAAAPPALAPPSSSVLTSTLTYLPLVQRNAPGVVPSCRYGVAAWPAQMAEFDIVDTLRAGWYSDFSARWLPPGPSRSEYVQMIHLGQDRGGSDVCGPDYGYWTVPELTDDGLGLFVDNNPGALWIVGNEPDRIRQNDVCPQQYAQAYHDVYHFIKGRDPTAQVAMAGLVQVTPGRLQYLDIVWDTYRTRYGADMPVDVWTMHIYILAETGDGDAHIALGTDPDLAIPFSFDCADPDSLCYAEHDDVDLFIEHVMRMRQWMHRHGQQDRPLLLTEYGINLPYHYYGMCTVESCTGGGALGCFCDENNETFHPRRVANYMEATFDYLSTATDSSLGWPDDGYRLVQRWMWYSLATDPPQPGHASNLVEPANDYALTRQGQRWEGYVADLPHALNLRLVQVPTALGYAPGVSDTVTVTLSAAVLNNGDVPLERQVQVTFYRDASMLEPVASASLNGLVGCARRTAVVTAAWEGLSAGTYSFWVKVDSQDRVAETRETDNVGQGSVFVAPYRLLLPLVANR